MVIKLMVFTTVGSEATSSMRRTIRFEIQRSTLSSGCVRPTRGCKTDGVNSSFDSLLKRFQQSRSCVTSSKRRTVRFKIHLSTLSSGSSAMSTTSFKGLSNSWLQLIRPSTLHRLCIRRNMSCVTSSTRRTVRFEIQRSTLSSDSSVMSTALYALQGLVKMTAPTRLSTLY